MKTKDPELPAFIKSWRQFYGVVIAWLALLILLFWIITLHFE